MKSLVALAIVLAASGSALAEDGAANNLARSVDWLAANATKPGVVTLPSGLQYKVLTSGDPGRPLLAIGDYVCTHAAGRFVDDTEFWARVEPEPAITFKSDAVIKGWQEALMLMRPGDVWEIYIPPQLAYGGEARGDIIGPNDALIFELWFYRSSDEPFPDGHDCRESGDSTK